MTDRYSHLIWALSLRATGDSPYCDVTLVVADPVTQEPIVEVEMGNLGVWAERFDRLDAQHNGVAPLVPAEVAP